MRSAKLHYRPLGGKFDLHTIKKVDWQKTVPVHVRRLSLFLERRGRIWVIHEVFFFFLSKCPKSFSLILTHTDTRNYSAHCGLVLFLSSLFSFFWWVCVCLSHRLLTFFILSLSLSLYNWIDSIFSLFFLFGLYALLRLVSVCVCCFMFSCGNIDVIGAKSCPRCYLSTVLHTL